MLSAGYINAVEVTLGLQCGYGNKNRCTLWAFVKPTPVIRMSTFTYLIFCYLTLAAEKNEDFRIRFMVRVGVSARLERHLVIDTESWQCIVLLLHT